MRTSPVLALLLVFGIHRLPAQEASITDSVPAVRAGTAGVLKRFEAGEKLIYDAKYGLLKVGRASMELLGYDTIRGQPALHARFQLQGGTMIYRLNDVLESWIDTSFTSVKFVQDYQEGGRKRYAEYHIYPDSGFYRQVGRDTAMVTSARPLDDAAFFYFVRTVDLEVGDTLEFHRYFKPDRNPVVLQVLKRDTIDVPAGSFPTLVVRPVIRGRGIFAEAKEARLWISDDERRLIVQMQTKFPFGRITLKLKKIVSAGNRPED